ncbi:NAD(P)/FAD-dependent oxidoreductase [Pullulanibacillus sp. KACC 23026]|uniref:NAD(P)/FAD-dependent oxidoreductase n=1 Tax=Pullulanibacillus sp. KACC 23026 TaxID=3028315 RepID=UPI0023AFEAA7|nr:NAD(P)/FAD-dependent oxidoreductase [Pullulanibacillus sp. KACC 23026]WEG13032.1 NAD(P)/FAD-dependent oxidoreductase [Pullulanibacillus sp. KACC 23026]
MKGEANVTYDVIVIGGGPSGLMATVAAASSGAKVLLIDKGNKLGRKLAISGGGRCNVTNRMPIPELIKHIPGNGKFLHSAFATFNNEDIITFFEGLGIQLKEEDLGRMFPVSNRAQDVVQALLDKIESLKVSIRTNAPVETVLYEEEGAVGVLLKNGEKIKTRAVIVAVGGKSVPQTGSTGDGYKWAKMAGHTITDLYPTEVPLTSSEPFIQKKLLQGLSLYDVAVSVLDPKGKPIITHQWDMIFTHFGLSGPAVLRCSQFVVKALKKYKTETIDLAIDVKPDQNQEELFQLLNQLAKEEPKKALKNVWKGIIPERYLLFLFDQMGVSLDLTYHELPKTVVRQLAEWLKGFKIRVNGTLPIEKAFITGGGVSLKEIDPKSMASKKMPGLYFCGEILDIHGYTGGYNITAAFSTGHAAGEHAAQYAQATVTSV